MKNIMRSIAVFGLFGLLGACAAPVDVGSENDTSQAPEDVDQVEASEPGSDDDETSSVEQAAVNYSYRFARKRVLPLSPTTYKSQIGKFCFNNTSCASACATKAKLMSNHSCQATGAKIPSRVAILAARGAYYQEWSSACFCKL